jgi:hypothetical protein
VKAPKSGSWFHSYENGELAQQGRVIGPDTEAPEHFIVEYLSFVHPDERVRLSCVSLAAMHDWHFFPTSQAMQASYGQR